MTAQTLLIENFEYDLWANKLWFEFLPHATPEEQAVFAHILMSQKIWSDRINGYSATELPVVEATLEHLNELHRTWISLINARDYYEPIAYNRTTGELKSGSFGHITRHVANHGTYHRGHLRGLCQARNCTDFPETDLILFNPTN